jgi:ribosome recycling factor
MSHAVLDKLKKQCEESLQALGRDLAKLRTGRANPALLDNVKVDYYGTLTPLKQMANVTVPESRQLLIAPWDQSQIANIEKAILASDLGLTPSNDGKVVRIQIPALTEERRKELAKIAKGYGENAKVAMRTHRRDGNEEFKKLLKDKKITEDDNRRFETEVQKTTDDFTKKVDTAIAAKEKEILEV